MTKFAEAYLHYRLRSRHEADLEDLARLVLQVTETAASEFYPYLEWDAVARVEEASRKVWGTVIVGALAIANYGSIRSGLDILIKDGRNVTSFVIDHVRDSEQVTDAEMVRHERRRAFPGRLRGLFDSVAIGALTPTAATEKAVEIMSKAGVRENELEIITPRLDHEFQRESHQFRAGRLPIAEKPKRLPKPDKPRQIPHPAIGPAVIAVRNREDGTIRIDRQIP